MRFKTVAWVYFDSQNRKKCSNTHLIQTKFDQEVMTFCGQMIPLASEVLPFGVGLCEVCQVKLNNIEKKLLSKYFSGEKS